VYAHGCACMHMAARVCMLGSACTRVGVPVRVCSGRAWARARALARLRVCVCIGGRSGYARSRDLARGRVRVCGGARVLAHVRTCVYGHRCACMCVRVLARGCACLRMAARACAWLRVCERLCVLAHGCTCVCTCLRLCADARLRLPRRCRTVVPGCVPVGSGVRTCVWLHPPVGVCVVVYMCAKIIIVLV
jgi:hypothetical protein